MNAVNVTESTYDFNSEENLSKWKGVLTNPLKKVLETVHPSLGARDDALDYVEHLCLRLLGMLCAKPSPHTVQDVEYKVQTIFPTPIDKWALKEAQEALEKGKKKSTLVLPVDKIHTLLQKEILLYKVDSTVALFLVAVLEYISADILNLAGNYVKNIRHMEITYQDIQISMNADKALMDMFYQDEGGGPCLVTESPLLVSSAPRSSLTYEEVVRELIQSEKSYIKELHMIIKVFREEMLKLVNDPKDIEPIFSNIIDIYELTYTLSGSLEDVIEMSQDQMPFIASCFEELAEAAEFDVYIKYARDVTASQCRETLNQVLSQPEVATHPMKLALKYYLPASLLAPIRNCFSYIEYIRLLRGLSTTPDEVETLTQVEGLLKPLQIELTRCAPCLGVSRTFATLPQIRAKRQAAIDKVHELEKLVENWDGKDLGQCCNEFIREDILLKVSSGKRLTERRVFLFDGLMILCKPNPRRQSSLHHQNYPECKMKERFFIRKVEIIDHANSDDLKHAFEISPRHLQTPIILCAKTLEEKNSWMADLVMLNSRSMLERTLDNILADIERRHPLKLPPPELYKFAEPDSKDNIILEQRENGGVALIKGATLYKLVERLTYHIYADPKFIRTFLTTYRSFCSPTDLLNLLIERFQIPDPSLVYGQECDSEKVQKSNQREDWKKYRKEYCQPIQFRVFNVLRHWVDNHYYDFERDPELLVKLHEFLHSVNGKNMRKWVDSVLKIVQRKRENDQQRHITFAFDELPPPIEWHIQPCPEEEFGILTLHPVEIARQLTILEFDLYKTIKPSELVGTVWMKKDKEISSPNLLKMIKHTTNFTRWVEKSIIDAENFEERLVILNRIIETMIALNDINNFNGVVAITSATGSAAVHRLKFTLQALSQHKQKALEECKPDEHFKRYQERLRSINPPCVPFVGMYLTNILHIEEGNSDCLPNTELINFFKRRRVAEITGEIQQYQNQPYCYSVEPRIRNFLENLNPFEDMSDTDISNYLYNKSLEIEPRNCKIVPKFPRKWPHINLKVKPRMPSGTRQLASSTSTLGTSSSLASTSLNSIAFRTDDSKSDDSSRTDNDFSVFAPVQFGTGQNSPTTSPVSPAGPCLRTSLHMRSPSTSSTCSKLLQGFPKSETALAGLITGLSNMPMTNRINSHSSIAPSSPGPHSPNSPGPFESISPRLSCTPPPLPPPLPPRRRRDSPETNSPQQIKHNSESSSLFFQDPSPPPLPPRRDAGLSPSSHSHHSFIANHTSNSIYALPLNPTHTSRLYIRRHSTHPQIAARNGVTNTTVLLPQQPPPPLLPPSTSPRYNADGSPTQITPRLPPRPGIRSAEPTTENMFQYPSSTTN